jgi:hypothetical protein
MQETIWRCGMPVKKRGGGTEPHGEIIEDYEPFTFALEGSSYSADLCEAHKQEVRDCLIPVISISDKTPSRASQAVRGALKGRKGSFTTKDVRRWLRDQGVEVPDSGRLPNEHIDRYRSAHSL